MADYTDLIARLLLHDSHPESAAKQAADALTALQTGYQRLRTEVESMRRNHRDWSDEESVDAYNSALDEFLELLSTYNKEAHPMTKGDFKCTKNI